MLILLLELRKQEVDYTSSLRVLLTYMNEIGEIENSRTESTFRNKVTNCVEVDSNLILRHFL